MHGALVEIRRYRVEALLGVTEISKGQPQLSYLDSLHQIMS